MDLQKLEKAKKLQCEIDELSAFLSHDGWKHKFFKIKTDLESPIPLWGGYDFKTYNPSNELKDKIKSAMQDYLADLLAELEEL
ncbi:hypothetical protein SAMN02910327_00401 [Peptostreptococcaceae bacterium pGA-8]|nr:hypothetical protein SAMN02910327_00401 [Peptostreptococcaceae bacterium pGA-8]